MKNLRSCKNLRRRHNRKCVEAYTCGVCGTPDDCITDCAGNFEDLQIGIQNAVYGMNGRLSY